jgi:hypothetical protein
METVEVLTMGVWKTYHPRVTTIHAMKMPAAFVVDVGGYRMEGRVGDYLVEGEKGGFYPLPAETFESKYKPVYHVVTYPEAGMKRTRRAMETLK